MVGPDAIAANRRDTGAQGIEASIRFQYHTGLLMTISNGDIYRYIDDNGVSIVGEWFNVDDDFESYVDALYDYNSYFAVITLIQKRISGEVI